jgi:hypothetical protein
VEREAGDALDEVRVGHVAGRPGGGEEGPEALDAAGVDEHGAGAVRGPDQDLERERPLHGEDAAGALQRGPLRWVPQVGEVGEALVGEVPDRLQVRAGRSQPRRLRRVDPHGRRPRRPPA